MSRHFIAASAFRSITGARRPSNQDRFLVDHEMGFVLLADGVAGRPAGDRAAQIAVDAAALQLRLTLPTGRGTEAASHLLAEAFGAAAVAVHRCRERDAKLANMASTLVGALFVDGHAIVANLGDSRSYRLRHASLKQITVDHVLRREGLADLSKEDASAVQPLQLLTRAVGYGDPVEPDIVAEPLSPGDAYLFCSNGLSDVLERHRIAEVVLRAESLEQACQLLVEDAVAAGSKDDVTVILAQPCSGEEADHGGAPVL